jgi:hypothetical protein
VALVASGKTWSEVNLRAQYGRPVWMTAAIAFEPVAQRNRFLQLLRRNPLISYFVIAYAFTPAYDFLHRDGGT